MNKKSRILILGAYGLLGSACLRHFQQQQFENVFHPSREELDLQNSVAVHQYFATIKPEIIILAAGITGGILYNKTYPADFITVNLNIQLNVFQAAQKNNSERLVFFASSCMYPRECSQPMNEEQLLTGKLETTSMSYAMAKLAGMQMCVAYNQQFGGNRFITLIPNTMYGPNSDFDPKTSHVMTGIMTKMHDAKIKAEKSITLWGTGSPRREFVFSEDVARATAHVLSQPDNIPVPMNVGVGHDYSIKELAETIAKVVGFQGEIIWDTTKPDGAPQKLLNNQKITNLGWKPLISIEEGIQRTYDWYLKNILMKEKNHETVSI